MLLPKSAAQGIVWPALPNPTDSLLLALQYQLEQSQWRSPLSLQQMQLLQLTALLSYASRAVPFYRERLLAIPRLGKRCLTMSDLRSMPILTRAELQQNGDKLKERSCTFRSSAYSHLYHFWLDWQTSSSNGNQGDGYFLSCF